MQSGSVEVAPSRIAVVQTHDSPSKATEADIRRVCMAFNALGATSGKKVIKSRLLRQLRSQGVDEVHPTALELPQMSPRTHKAFLVRLGAVLERVPSQDVSFEEVLFSFGYGLKACVEGMHNEQAVCVLQE